MHLNMKLKSEDFALISSGAIVMNSKEDSPKQKFVKQFRCIPSKVLTILDIILKQMIINAHLLL